MQKPSLSTLMPCRISSSHLLFKSTMATKSALKRKTIARMPLRRSASLKSQLLPPFSDTVSSLLISPSAWLAWSRSPLTQHRKKHSACRHSTSFSLWLRCSRRLNLARTQRKDSSQTQINSGYPLQTPKSTALSRMSKKVPQLLNSRDAFLSLSKVRWLPCVLSFSANFKKEKFQNLRRKSKWSPMPKRLWLSKN